MSKMHDRSSLPLRGLQVFAAAARAGQFTAAARALRLTQSAVSRHIQALEEDLGLRLFQRRGPQLRLTPEGAALAAALAAPFAALESALDQARAAPPQVTLSMLPSVAAKWMAPRLSRFAAAHPGVDLRIAASPRLADFRQDGVDAALRYGPGGWPGVEAFPLGGEVLFPVCSPAYAQKLGLAVPQDLARAQLLRSDLPQGWPEWLGAAGLGDMPWQAGPLLTDDTALLEAAAEAQGVALARSRLVAEDLRAGRLIALPGPPLPAAYLYWFVWPEGRARSPALLALRAFIQAEFAASLPPEPLAIAPPPR